MVKRFLCLFCLLFFFSSLAFAGKFKDLIPGASKKADADRVLGSPIREIVRGEVYEYSPEAPDARRISIKFSKKTQVIESIDLYMKSRYDKSKFREWFKLGEPARKEIDTNGKLVEYYLPEKVSLHYWGADDSNPVEYFSHFAPSMLEKEKIVKSSPEKNAPEKRKAVSPKPILIEPPGLAPEGKIGISSIPGLGVDIQNLTKEVADSVNLLEGSGVLVKSVKSGGVADLAGISAGDVILRFENTWVTDVGVLSELVNSTPAGRESHLYIDRRGTRYHFTIVLGESKKEGVSLAPTQPHSQDARVLSREYYETELKRLFENKNFQQIRPILDEGLQIYPESPSLWSYEGRYYFFSTDETAPLSVRSVKALGAAKKAVDLDPTATNYFNMGLVYHYMFKDYSSALNYYEKATNHPQQYLTGYYFIGICYEELRNLDKAVSAYEEFLRVAPNDQYAQAARNRLAELRQKDK
jgi:Tfp pilus assembly protein PilF